MTPLFMATILVAASVASAFAALVLISVLLPGHWRKSPALATGTIEPTVFLFEAGELVDATRPAHLLLERIGGAGSDHDRLVAYLSGHFPDLAGQLARLRETGDVTLTAGPDRPLSLSAEYLGTILRLTLVDLESEGQGVTIDGLSLRAQEEEIATLRETLSILPYPVWRLDGAGQIAWANNPYLQLVRDQSGNDDLTWPLPVLFSLPADALDTGLPKRLSLAGASGRSAHWYDCHSRRSGGGSLHFALLADPVVKAETALRDFVQTLTKTFAHLPIGLAIFDRQRQLALFNPALIDLTTLAPDYLSGRPTLFSFLDRLREARIIPEPKDYASWRLRMTTLEQAASSGQYEETWSLATGQTYRVSGRPHADGAVAFFFEDISAEISLTRRFRSEIEMGQSVIDALEDAIAVFSPNGDLVLSNAAYGQLWGVDPATSLGQMTVTDATRHWQRLCHPTPAWGDLRDFVVDLGERSAWDADITLTDGRHMTVRFTPANGNATLVRFHQTSGRRLQVHHSRPARPPAPPEPRLHLDA